MEGSIDPAELKAFSADLDLIVSTTHKYQTIGSAQGSPLRYAALSPQ